VNEAQVQLFWQTHPCGDHQVGGLEQSFALDYLSFFQEYDAFRYRREAHILECLNAIDFQGKRLLEIGLGQGADSEQIIRRGARWSGLDLTAESVARVRARLELRKLAYDELKEGSALSIPYADNIFDMVFSHGVLHHIPQIRVAQAEIARVLKPGGELVIMVYAKYSFNYLVAIGLVRRLGLILLYAANLDLGGFYGAHLRNARRMGLLRYLAMRNFVHHNTDGPDNPYSKVYSLAQIRSDFPDFRILRAYKRWMHGPPLPISRLPLGRVLGWHLWVHMTPRKI
jgi:ubiquinone/menaquinone biosynthesis C-methylase UbiE